MAHYGTGPLSSPALLNCLQHWVLSGRVYWIGLFKCAVAGCGRRRCKSVLDCALLGQTLLNTYTHMCMPCVECMQAGSSLSAGLSLNFVASGTILNGLYGLIVSDVPGQVLAVQTARHQFWFEQIVLAFVQVVCGPAFLCFLIPPGAAGIFLCGCAARVFPRLQLV